MLDVLGGVGSLVSAGLNYFGGRQNAAAVESANLQNALLAQRAQDLGQSNFQQTMAANLAINQQNIDLQREFAQHGISWRAADARAAGLAPSAALGASGATFSPVASVGGGSVSSPGSVFQPNTAMGSALGAMGQDISRALMATSRQGQRDQAMMNASNALTLENKSLQNELLKSQIARSRQAQIGPALPTAAQRWGISGQGAWPSSPITEKFERVPPDPSSPALEHGSVADIRLPTTVGGGKAAVPSKDVAESIEDNLIQQIMWTFRNNLLPTFGLNQADMSHIPTPKPGQKWMYHPFWQEYRPHDSFKLFGKHLFWY